jgi:hypothetical protein
MKHDTSHRTRRGGLVALLAFVAPLAVAQQGPNAPVRVRGTVEQIGNGTLVLKGADGATGTFKLAPKVLYSTREPASLGAIKPGDFVASAAVKGKDGKLHSTELRIFPEAMRGNGEGQRPMNEPDTMMTNATVSAVEVPPSQVQVAPEGRVLKVKYKGGDSELVVGPEVKIFRIVPSDIAQLKAGASVTVTSTQAADGSQVATAVAAN